MRGGGEIYGVKRRGARGIKKGSEAPRAGGSAGRELRRW